MEKRAHHGRGRDGGERGGEPLDALDRMIVDRIQRSFPVVARPYAALAEVVGSTEAEILARVASLKGRGVVRQISAIFNTGALGYRSSLVGMAVPEERLDAAALVVNAYPGVSHNYVRPGRFNMWFTVAVPPWDSLEGVVGRLSGEAGGLSTLILPAIRRFKLAVVLYVLEEGEWDAGPEEDRAPAMDSVAPFPGSPRNISIVRCIQEDLPLVSHPFAPCAEALGLKEESLVSLISEWTERGYVRRFAAVLDHRRVGFRANGMIVWKCPPERIEEAGIFLAAQAEVSHCYHRPAYPEWPYTLYAMTHGKTFEDCQVVAWRLARDIGLPEYDILFSTRELKKIRLKLFWDDPPGREGAGA